MKFFFPDSQDQVDPNFDFVEEEHLPHHQRQRDDFYAHEILGEPVADGLLVSMGTGRYSFTQKQRLYRVGVREFFRLDEIVGARIETLGDCGAFGYADEPVPPYTVEEVLSYYEDCRFDAGVSVDHVILGFIGDKHPKLPSMDAIPSEWIERRELSIELASEFFALHQRRKCSFQPVGAAQGWNPDSYAESVRELVQQGYRRIGLGGLVSLKTPEILSVLQAASDAAAGAAEFHLFGVTRCEQVGKYEKCGVTSIDSTSPFRQAFKDDRDNYHSAARNYVAVRVPQVDANAKLKRAIRAGLIDQAEAMKLERECLLGLREWGEGRGDLDDLLDNLDAYERLYSGKATHRQSYSETLQSRIWEQCACRICQTIGIDVVTFRGSERNKRRGFHNLWVFRKRLHEEVRFARAAVGNS